MTKKILTVTTLIILMLCAALTGCLLGYDIETMREQASKNAEENAEKNNIAGYLVAGPGISPLDPEEDNFVKQLWTWGTVGVRGWSFDPSIAAEYKYMVIEMDWSYNFVVYLGGVFSAGKMIENYDGELEPIGEGWDSRFDWYDYLRAEPQYGGISYFDMTKGPAGVYTNKANASEYEYAEIAFPTWHAPNVPVMFESIERIYFTDTLPAGAREEELINANEAY